MPGESKVCLSLWGGLTGWHFIPPALRKELSLHFHVKRPANMLPMKFSPMLLQAKTCGKMERSCTPGWGNQTFPDSNRSNTWTWHPLPCVWNSDEVPICMGTSMITVDLQSLIWAFQYSEHEIPSHSHSRQMDYMEFLSRQNRYC